jgi:8-oxo-dGTP pyrophosphatase MutT (NUDIX family)
MLLSQDKCEYLQRVLSTARSPVPDGWHPWYLAGCSQPLGIMSPERANLFMQLLPAHTPLVTQGSQWVWMAEHLSPTGRERILQEVAKQLLDQGAVVGWRDETYTCWAAQQTDWPYRAPECFRLERSAFRFFGLRSHAAHVHGLTTDGRMWCGRRSSSKAIDPGLLDNLAAGGLPSGEDPHGCAVREIFEEAGLQRDPSQVLVLRRALTTERAEPEGWHSENIFVYTTEVADDETPNNQDGEVSEFLCLEMSEVLERMQSGEFTHDAACAIALHLLHEAP